MTDDLFRARLRARLTEKRPQPLAGLPMTRGYCGWVGAPGKPWVLVCSAPTKDGVLGQMVFDLMGSRSANPRTWVVLPAGQQPAPLLGTPPMLGTLPRNHSGRFC